MRSMRITPWHPLVGLAALLAAIALAPPVVRAADREPGAPSVERGFGMPSTVPGISMPRDAGSPISPKVSEIRPLLDARDEVAALEAVRVALTEVADGSTYVWYRHGGRLSGLVQPTQSFKDVLGRVCRHIVVTLNDASRSKRTQGIACRLSDGGWELDG